MLVAVVRDAGQRPEQRPGQRMLVELDDAGHPSGAISTVDGAGFPDAVRDREAEHPRWVWESTAEEYPTLLAAGVRVERCADLRLDHAILRTARAAAGSDLARAVDDPWAEAPSQAVEPDDDALFSTEAAPAALDPVAEVRRQLAAVDAADDGGRLRLLLAAESVGSLVAAELRHVGLPWSVARHEELLAGLLGNRPPPGSRPARMAELLDEVRTALDEPDLDPDSPVALLRGLQNAGLRVASTRSWELKEVEHPAIPPLLEYKKLARLLTANGWTWLEQWVADGRFRPTYVPGGVVTGRWASDGGGALQLPRQLRGAVVADPGWRLVVADAAQLEPRVLAAMSGDDAMARAGRAQDLYEGIVASGAVADRREAKYGMLGAIYGGTSGVSAKVLPRLQRTFPQAMGLVERAARRGEDGERVETWLGRTSPAGTGGGFDETLTDAQRRSDQSRRRAWGRFTRNFVVQGTAAEWALCWMGAVRRRLWDLGEAGRPGGTVAPFARRPHLAFFLHDELVVHTPAELADDVAAALRESATEAGRLLFPAAPVEWALSLAVVESYDRAK